MILAHQLSRLAETSQSLASSRILLGELDERIEENDRRHHEAVPVRFATRGPLVKLPDSPAINAELEA